MILAVGNIKGGVGKSMLAVNIAVALAQRGRDVLLIDGDEQASAATFAQIRADLTSGARFATDADGAGRLLRQLHGLQCGVREQGLGLLPDLHGAAGRGAPRHEAGV